MAREEDGDEVRVRAAITFDRTLRRMADQIIELNAGTDNLVIVESPAKAKTISKFLGATFDVRASVGHVADLPSKGLNIDVDNGFTPTYELTDRGKQVVKVFPVA